MIFSSKGEDEKRFQGGVKSFPWTPQETVLVDSNSQGLSGDPSTTLSPLVHISCCVVKSGSITGCVTHGTSQQIISI